MTDPSPLDDRDALASSYLDGLATLAQTAEIEANPELVARVRALQRVRSAVISVPGIDAARRDEAIAAALAAYDEDEDVAPVSPLVGASQRRRAPSPRPWRVLGAAAAIAAVVALVPLVASLTSSSPDDDRIELAGDQPPDAADAAGTPDSPAASAEAMVSTTAPTLDPVAGLGSFATDEALVAAIGASGVESPLIAEALPVDPTPCLDVLAEGLPDDGTVLVTTATVAGAPVTVAVTAADVRITGGDCTAVRVYRR